MTFLDITNIRSGGNPKKGPLSKSETIVKYLAALAVATAQQSM